MNDSTGPAPFTDIPDLYEEFHFRSYFRSIAPGILLVFNSILLVFYGLLIAFVYRRSDDLIAISLMVIAFAFAIWLKANALTLERERMYNLMMFWYLLMGISIGIMGNDRIDWSVFGFAVACIIVLVSAPAYPHIHHLIGMMILLLLVPLLVALFHVEHPMDLVNIVLFVVIALPLTVIMNRGALGEMRAVHKLALQHAYLARHDQLTGLLNRHAFYASLDQIDTGRDAPVSCLYIDVDHFKSINDTFGHATGDSVLVEFGTHVRQHLPEGGLAARFGGEEFVIILPRTSTDDAVALAHHLQQRPRANADDKLIVTASIGLVTAESGDDLERILRIADDAMYEAKQLGRNRVQVLTSNSPGRVRPERTRVTESMAHTLVMRPQK